MIYQRALKGVVFLLTIILILPSFSSAEIKKGSLTLQDSYQLAIKKSEQLQIKEQEVKFAEAQYKEAISKIYPGISLNGEYRKRDNSEFGRVSRGNSGSSDDPSNSIGGGSSSLGRSQSGAVISLTQPLFNGFRDYYLAQAAESEIEANKAIADRAKELLFLDVSDIFTQIVFAEKELAVLGRSAKGVRERVDELNEFVKLGKSRESEVLSTKAELAELEASQKQLEGLRKASLELMAFLTGKNASEIKLSLSDKDHKLEVLSKYLENVSKRSDLLASRARVVMQEKLLTASERERWPSLDLQGNAYTLDDPDRNREWELVLQLSLPIFTAGGFDARVAQKAASLRIAQLNSQELEREIEKEIRVAYTNLVSVKDEISALKNLYSAAEKNLAVQRSDYKNGIVTNIDVLQAIRQLQDAELRLVRADRSYYSNLNQLKVASGAVER